jgi:hypothetical protein
MKRTLTTLATIGALAVGLVLSAAPAEAAGTITPWQSEVAIGAAFSASANGCPASEEEGDTSYVVQRAELRVVVGSGAGRRFAAFGQTATGVRQRFVLPGWLDPSEPAAIEGSCVRSTYDFETDQETTEVLFTYPAAAFDVVAGTPASSGPNMVLSRTTAAGGQAIRVEVTGCETSNFATVAVLEGDDLTLAGSPRYLTGNHAAIEGGAATVDLALNGQRGEDDAGPLPEGTYTVVAVCVAETDEDAVEQASAPQLVTVVGTSPSGELAIDVVDEQLVVTGLGCSGGRSVSVRLVNETSEERRPSKALRAAGVASARGDLVAAASAVGQDPVRPNLTSGETTVTPEADGTWTFTQPIEEDDIYVVVEASRGDPVADGFVYVPRSLFLGGPSADVYAERVSPTSSPTNGEPANHASRQARYPERRRKPVPKGSSPSVLRFCSLAVSYWLGVHVPAPRPADTTGSGYHRCAVRPWSPTRRSGAV